VSIDISVECDVKLIDDHKKLAQERYFFLGNAGHISGLMLQAHLKPPCYNGRNPDALILESVFRREGHLPMQSPLHSQPPVFELFGLREPRGVEWAVRRSARII